jgi:hypothetical protein
MQHWPHDIQRTGGWTSDLWKNFISNISLCWKVAIFAELCLFHIIIIYFVKNTVCFGFLSFLIVSKDSSTCISLDLALLFNRNVDSCIYNDVTVSAVFLVYINFHVMVTMVTGRKIIRDAHDLNFYIILLKS